MVIVSVAIQGLGTIAGKASRLVSMRLKWPVVFAIASVLSGCDSFDNQVHKLSGAAQGTTWHVSVWQSEGVDVNALQQRIDAEFNRLDRSLSNYKPDSDIERFNATETTAPIDDGSEIVELVEAAKQVSQASQGCYDLTIKPLFDLWGFSGQTLTPPDPATLMQQLQHVGFSKLETPTPTQLRKTDPQIHVDISSIAQGYSVGRVATVVEAAGIQNYLVEIGGELQTRGLSRTVLPGVLASRGLCPVVAQLSAQGVELLRRHLVVGTHHLAEQSRRGKLEARRLETGTTLPLGEHLLKESLDIG